MNPVNTLARALVFVCYDEQLSKLASDNPIHGNRWPEQKLSRDTVRMLSTFVHQFGAEWAKMRKDSPDWHEVGLVLADCGAGYDDDGPLLDACKRAIREVWAGYSDNASWRLTKQGTLHLDCPPPQTPNPKRRPSVAKDIH